MCAKFHHSRFIITWDIISWNMWLLFLGHSVDQQKHCTILQKWIAKFKLFSILFTSTTKVRMVLLLFSIYHKFLNSNSKTLHHTNQSFRGLLGQNWTGRGRGRGRGNWRGRGRGTRIGGTRGGRVERRNQRGGRVVQPQDTPPESGEGREAAGGKL